MELYGNGAVIYKVLHIAFCCFIAFQSMGQLSVTRTAIGTLGQSVNVSSGNTYMYNAGETVVETGSTTSLEITQGFEQPPYARDTSILPPDTSGTGSLPESILTNAFSPDGDGVNDTWLVDQLTTWNQNTVTIMNRWGDKIWEAENYDNINVVWDGTNQSGQQVGNGTYFYVITINNAIRSYSGWVQVTR